MLKITQIKVPQSTLALQKHPSTSGFIEIIKIREQNYRIISTELSKCMSSSKDEEIWSRIRWSIVEKVYGKTKIIFCPLFLAEKVHSL